MSIQHDRIQLEKQNSFNYTMSSRIGKINKSDLVEKCSLNNNLSTYPDKFNVNIENEINKTTNQIIKLPNTRFQGSKKKI